MEREIYNPYEKYGLRRVVNAATDSTSIGGSISPPEVFKAMEDASKSFVSIVELQQWAGKILAEATGAEAGLPTAGGSCAIILAAAACIMKDTELENYDPLKNKDCKHISMKLPMHTEGLKTDFIIQKVNRNNYDHAIECAGGRLIAVGTDEGTTEEELNAAFDPERTAAYYFTDHLPHKPEDVDKIAEKRLPLKTVIRIAHNHGCPVVVDAASELPFKKNLRKFISKGADLVIFSGGKFISGPNNSGFLVGKKELIKLAHLQSYPFMGIGRAAKMSRETIVGLITALKIYLELDEKPLFIAWENKAKWIAEQLNNITNVEAEVDYLTTGDPRANEREPNVPVCYVKIDSDYFGITESDLSNKLKEGNPIIDASYRPSINKLRVNPEFMFEGEEILVVQRIKEILTHAR